jgi:hypothetical protein
MSEPRTVPKASDITDAAFLAVVAACNDGTCTLTNDRHTMLGGAFVRGGHWCLVSDLATALPTFPEKVILAKAKRVIAHGLLSEGCACGCRGDFEINEKGRALLTDQATPSSTDA